MGVKTAKAKRCCEKSHKMKEGLRLREVPVNNSQGNFLASDPWQSIPENGARESSLHTTISPPHAEREI